MQVVLYLPCVCAGSAAPQAVTAAEGESELGRASFLLLSGLEEDEEGNIQEAIALYSDAAALCIATVSTGSAMLLQSELRYK